MIYSMFNRYNRLLGGILFMMFSVNLILSQTSLINPTISSSFIDDYVLPDGTVRFIGSEHGAHRELFFVDRLVDGNITDPVFFPESFEEIEFNFAGVDCKILPLPSGDLLMGINQQDCDYSPYSSIARFNQDGDVVWAISMEHFFFDFAISKFIWVDSNVISVISDHSDSLYFDVNGNEVPHNPAFIVYDTVIMSGHGIYASIDSNMYKLNEDFVIIDSTKLDNDIISIHVSKDSMFIVTTLTSVWVLDASLGPTASDDGFHHFNLIASSAAWIWIGHENGTIIQLNYQLQPQNSFYMHPDIKLKSVNGINGEIVLGGNYISAVTASVFFHSTPEADFNFKIIKDVAIDAVSVKEPVQYTFNPFGYPWAFNIPYEDLIVRISNTGNDTIQSLSFRYQASSGCSFCHPERIQWDLDSLHLIPGGTLEVDLGGFYASCITTNPSTFCMSVLPADSLPEISKENNSICISVDALLSDVMDAEQTLWEVFPNPVNEILTIRSNYQSVDEHRMEIFNSVGQKIMSRIIGQLQQDFHMDQLAPGLYLVVISNTDGLVEKHKIVLNGY